MKNKIVRPFFWYNSSLYIIDQIKLPYRKVYIKCRSYKDVYESIKKMIVRGAPVIGLVGGYGILLAIKEAKCKNLKNFIVKAAKKIISARPTAYNLYYVVNRMKEFVLKNSFLSKNELFKIAVKEMNSIQEENYNSMLKIVKNGVSLFKKNSIVLTHCNTGILACGDIGTALGIIIEGYKKKKVKYVYVDETRPYLQGARLTMFELISAGVPCCLVTDNMAAYVIKEKKVDYVIVGADRIARNGDTANKIGTYNLAILAKYHNIPFYVAAPSSTIDVNISSGREIVVEYRSEKEVKYVNDKLITLKNAEVLHPAFDITPAELITAIITEKGIFNFPYDFRY